VSALLRFGADRGASRVADSALEAAPADGWPPPPHDPRERELIATVCDWEIRLFAERQFQYLVRNGFWHVQLWHPEARVSVLTPSRLTRDRYEVFPIAGWKAGAKNYQELAKLIADEHSVSLLPELGLRELELILVQRVQTRAQRLS
jgi:hypothetical protein